MLKQFHVFSRGDVVDALKSERSQKETLRLRPAWAFSSPYFLLLFSEGKISRGENKNVVRTIRDRQWLQQSSVLREHWATYLGSDIKRHLKQDLGTQEMVPELRHFPSGATESWSHSRKRYHIVTCLLFDYFLIVFLSVFVGDSKWLTAGP